MWCACRWLLSLLDLRTLGKGHFSVSVVAFVLLAHLAHKPLVLPVLAVRQACVVGDESSCDASLYSKICRCSGDTILTTRPAGAETSSSSVVDLSGDDPCSVNWAIQLRPDSAETTNFQLNIELESTAPGQHCDLRARATMLFVCSHQTPSMKI